MPRTKNSVPSYRKHSSSQARVTLDGQVFYLGRYGSPESKEKYRQLTAEYLTNNYSLPKPQQTVSELIAAYWLHSQSYYVKNGKPTDELHCIKSALRIVRQQYGKAPISDFGPLALKQVREGMAAQVARKLG